MEKTNPIDLSDSQNCRDYLLDKFHDLFFGVNNLYGKELMELLVARLERTIAIFHQDVQKLLSEIKHQESQAEWQASVDQALSSPSAVGDEDEWSKHLF